MFRQAGLTHNFLEASSDGMLTDLGVPKGQQNGVLAIKRPFSSNKSAIRHLEIEQIMKCYPFLAHLSRRLR